MLKGYICENIYEFDSTLTNAERGATIYITESLSKILKKGPVPRRMISYGIMVSIKEKEMEHNEPGFVSLQDHPTSPDTSNPKDAIGSTKVPMNLIPPTYIAETSLAFLEGKLKYGQVNWRATDVRASVYLDACLRHIAKYAEGQERDPITKVHHLANASACLGILIDAKIHGTLIDDRNMSNEQSVALIESLSATVKHLQELFSDKNPIHYTKGAQNDQVIKKDPGSIDNSADYNTAHNL